ncbi:MAG TPA: serine/threonine-protein kinase, partial [Polyangiaceae bacterium]|nr:serine/threonine-protein kinase [Polyangiaceae bacterium]
TQLLNTGDFIEPWRGAPAAVSSDDLVGATLNDSYAVERLLGEGGMGRVFLARHTRIAQKRVAVKVLHPEFAANQQVLARFQREAEAAAAIAHPNVAAVLDIDVTPRGMPYLVCEYLEGIDLADHLREVKRLDVLDALSITRQLCRGLYAAHSRGVIHRDLKPPNVFLVGDFSKGAPPRLYAKILDFGLSSFRAGEGEQNLTKTGIIMGTPSYMAPEQARGKRVDHRADVYGLGTILYTVLTGRAPFDEESPQATILALLNSEPPRPRSLVPSIPPHLELVIERAMAKNPDDRYPDMLAFEQALDALPASKALTQSLPLAALTAPTPQPQTISRPMASDADVHAARPRLLLSLSSAVLLLVAGATVAISGLELGIGYSFSKVELRLILLGIVGTSLTPTLLWFLYIRRKVWESSSRVLALLAQVRAAVLAGIVTYGLLVLLSHVIDDFLVRFISRRDLQPLGVAWAGWNLLLPAIALVVGVTVSWRARLLTTVQPGWRRLLAAWLGVALATAISGGLIYFGILWRAAMTR